MDKAVKEGQIAFPYLLALLDSTDLDLIYSLLVKNNAGIIITAVKIKLVINPA